MFWVALCAWMGLWAYEARIELGARGDLFTRGRVLGLGYCRGKLLAGDWVKLGYWGTGGSGYWVVGGA